MILAPEDRTSAQFAELGIRFIPFPINRRALNPLVDLNLVRRLRTIYRAEHPDFVFHFTIKPVIYGSIAARYAGVSRIYNMIPGLGYVFAGDRVVPQMLRPLVKRMYKIALKDSQVVFFQNKEDREYFESNLLVNKKQSEITLGSGVDLDQFSFAESLPKDCSCTFLLFSRMLWDKGVGEFADAARVLKKELPEARFQLLGRIDTENPAHVDPGAIEAWVAGGFIEYLGEMAEVRNVIAAADVVVLPSYYREGVPKSLLEALAMGKAIITTDTPGCRETVVDKLNGILIAPRDVGSLTTAMRFMATQPERRVEMGKAGRRIAVDRFDVKRVNATILKAMQVA
jgi:glycosyltransferase involved in cell wall biosynthesis